jgi:organic radical activating enzyme
MFSITEIFESIQGEGFFVGTPALFIRLAGCNLECSWCDTDHREVFTLPLSLLCDVIQHSKRSHVVITGGEPTLQEGITDVIDYAISIGKTVQIETNGTTELDLSIPELYVTVSPKDPSFIRRQGNELKLVWDPDKWAVPNLAALRKDTDFHHYYLQPIWLNHRSNIDDVVAVLLNISDWRLSLQTHKYIGVR